VSKKFIVAIALLVSSFAGANAGTITDGKWTVPSCGQEPAAPDLDLSSKSKYNTSIAAAQLYQQQAKDYDACMLKEANGDVAMINDAFKSEHQRIRDNFDKLQTESQAAAAKFNTK
jgi:hypothetical protein